MPAIFDEYILSILTQISQLFDYANLNSSIEDGMPEIQITIEGIGELVNTVSVKSP